MSAPYDGATRQVARARYRCGRGMDIDEMSNDGRGTLRDEDGAIRAPFL
jgi:hypothetical protein